MSVEFDPNNLVNQASNFLSTAITRSTTPATAPPQSYLPPAPGTVPAGQSMNGGDEMGPTQNNTMLYIGLGVAVLVVAVILLKK